MANGTKIKTHFKQQGKNVSVYVKHSQVSINAKKSNRFIDPTIDLGAEKWNHFKHHDWILDEKDPKDFYFEKEFNEKVS